MLGDELWNHLDNGDVLAVKKFLMDNPSFDINQGIDGGWTALRVAAYFNHHEIVSVLLAHPDIDASLQDSDGQIPVVSAAQWEMLRL